MNKYSSKAIKTAATVGMSLAMVLSNVAPVVSNLTSVAAASATDKQTTKAAQKVVAKVLEVLSLEADYTTAKYNEAVLGGLGSATELKIDDNTNLKGVTSATTLDGLLDKTSAAIVLSAELDGIPADDNFVTIATYFVDNSSYIAEEDLNTDALDFAKFVKGYADAKADLVTTGTYFNTDGKLGAEGTAVIKEVADYGVGKTSEEKKAAEDAYKAIKDNEKYLNAFAFGDEGKDGLTKDIVSVFMAEVKDYKDENEDVYNKAYVKALEETPIGSSTVYDLVEKNEAISYKELARVEADLKNIKNDKVKALTAIADYDDVKGSEEVANYIDGLETIVTEMKEVKELLKSTNADIKAYKKDLAKKVENLNKAADDYAAKSDDANQTALDQALNAFREADATALKNFVEDFIGQFYTVSPKQLSSGKYVVRLTDGEYGRYVQDTKLVFGLLETNSSTTGLEYLLTNVIDKDDSADTYYDTLVNTVSTVEELVKAVTTDIEGITMGSTLTDKQAAKIIAARKALNQLVTEGKIAPEYSSALTSKEKKAVLANAELIETLYFKLIMNGTITESGWVDKGNGNWDYINEDGSRPTKWVASGANWYYVKNGTMLRNSWIASDAQGTRWYYVDDAGVMVSNTTVNGYTFNSYGVWVK